MYSNSGAQTLPVGLDILLTEVKLFPTNHFTRKTRGAPPTQRSMFWASQCDPNTPCLKRFISVIQSRIRAAISTTKPVLCSKIQCLIFELENDDVSVVGWCFTIRWGPGFYLEFQRKCPSAMFHICPTTPCLTSVSVLDIDKQARRDIWCYNRGRGHSISVPAFYILVHGLPFFLNLELLETTGSDFSVGVPRINHLVLCAGVWSLWNWGRDRCNTCFAILLLLTLRIYQHLLPVFRVAKTAGEDAKAMSVLGAR